MTAISAASAVLLNAATLPSKTVADLLSIAREIGVAGGLTKLRKADLVTAIVARAEQIEQETNERNAQMDRVRESIEWRDLEIKQETEAVTDAPLNRAERRAAKRAAHKRNDGTPVRKPSRAAHFGSYATKHTYVTF